MLARERREEALTFPMTRHLVHVLYGWVTYRDRRRNGCLDHIPSAASSGSKISATVNHVCLLFREREGVPFQISLSLLTMIAAKKMIKITARGRSFWPVPSIIAVFYSFMTSPMSSFLLFSIFLLKVINYTII